MLHLALMTAVALTQAQDFSWNGAVAQGKTVTVKNIIGDITVEAAAGREVSVTAVKREGRRGDPEDVEIRRLEDGDGVTFCVVYPHHDDDGDCDMNTRRNHRNRWDDHNQNDTEVHITVRVPAGVKLSAGTVSGDVVARGIRGDTDARSVSGDVRLTDIEATVVEAGSVSGSIELNRINAEEVGAETVSGDVDFSGEIRPRGSYDLKTLSGDVVMMIPRNAGAEITGNTFSGDFNSSFPITTRSSSRYTRRQRINGTIGDGSARIRVESFSGDVDLRELGRQS
jgi:DUF4097 and DUF4098 domain-containing protein YvlB